ncbi:MAG: ribosome maturation factor RimP [Nocardioides sp.]
MTSPQHSGPNQSSGQGSASATRADAARLRIEDVVAGPLRTLGLDIEAVEITPAGKRRVLRVAVDKDGGPSLDDIAEATRRVSEVLDAAEVMGESPYTLEVTSRGVDRPLSLPRHWRRNVNRLVAGTLTGGEQLLGRIVAADDSGVDLLIEQVARRFDYAHITHALVQIEFNRPSATLVETQGSDL